MTVMLWCRFCERAYPAANGFCFDHNEDLTAMPNVDVAPAAEDDEPRPRSVCWNCGHRSPNTRNTDCIECKVSLLPPALVVRFRDGQVVLGRTETAELGRAGQYRYVFDSFGNVSRQHAITGVDPDGRAWIRPVPAAPNGTFVNGREIFETTTLMRDDEVRFAKKETDVTGRVRQPEFE